MNSGNAGRAQIPFCDEFLAGHSDYLDGCMAPLLAARMSAHADACPSCARYDRIVRKGLLLARELPEVEPAGDFELRLQHRLLHIDNAASTHAQRAPAAGRVAALGVAAAIGLLAWSPLLVRDATEEAAPAFAQMSAADEAAGAYVGPLVVESSWYPVALPEAPAHHAASVVSMFPGPYSPLVVTPPAHRSVRTVSSEYLPVD